MKGFARNIDELGRIVLPKEIRDANNLVHGTSLLIQVTSAGILLSKAEESCSLCGSAKDLITVDGITICRICGKKIAEVIG